MFNLRTAFIKFLGLGLGIGLGLGVCFLFWAWYAASPKLPKPWDTKSLTAEFEGVRTTGEKNQLVFYYALSNNTDFDYRISSESQVSISAKQTGYPSLVEAPELFKPKIPFFLPARQKMRFDIHVPHSTPIEEPSLQASKEELDKYRAALKAYLNDVLNTRLDGFVLFDPAKRYQVIFPPGWKSK
ncbi:MAG: hypothetical protein HY313_01305 [Acidobacteria bacterium]|nr:hypothetical protein [Acidobacteriota bacterium]